MQKTDINPTSYLAALPDESREPMQRLDVLISGIMEGQSRVVWEGPFWGGSQQTIIGYGDLRMTQARGRTVEWFMVGLALQKQYISVYVNAVEDRQYVAEKYAPELGKVKVGKSSISFRRLDDVNLDVLAKVISIARDQLETQA